MGTSGRRRLPPWLAAAAAAALAGCATTAPEIDLPVPPSLVEPVRPEYTLGCPDVIHIEVEGRPQLSRELAVRPDGRVDLGEHGRPRVEGLTPTEARGVVADALGEDVERVSLAVVGFESRQVYLVGETGGVQRAVAYRGPESLAAVLSRSGGLPEGCTVGEVTVVRSRVAEGCGPEVFHVPLGCPHAPNPAARAFVIRPNDRVFLAETRRSCLCRMAAPWLRPLLEAFWGVQPGGDGPLVAAH
jgi:hypothetical protein